MRYKKQFYENAFNIISVELPSIEGLLKETQFRHSALKSEKNNLRREMLGIKSGDFRRKNAKKGELSYPKFFSNFRVLYLGPCLEKD